MKTFLKYFLDANYRLLLLRLFFSPCSFEQLKKKTDNPETELKSLLQDLIDAELIEAFGHASNPIYRLRASVRQKVGKTVSRIIISLIFLVVTTVLKISDRKLDIKQMKRINHRWQS